MTADDAEPAPAPRPNPVRTLLARGSIYTVAIAVQTSASLLVLPAITRLLPADEYGVVAAAIVVQTMVGIIGTLGVSAAISLDWFAGDDGPERARGLVVTTVTFATITALVLELTGPLWTSVFFSGIDYSGAMRIAVWSAVFVAALSAGQAILLSSDRPGRFVVTAATSSAGAQLLGLLFVAVFDWGAAGYLGGVGIGFAVAAMIALWGARLNTRGLTDRALVRSALSVGLPTVPHALALYTLAAGDRIVIEHVDGLAEVGRYQVAYLVGALGIYLLAAANNAWGRLVYAAGDDQRWDVLAQTTAALFPLAALVAGGLALGAPLALLIAAPSGYDPLDLTRVSAIVSLSVLAYVGYLSNVHGVFWLRKTRVLAWSTPLAALINVGLNVLLVPPLGLEGSAIATVISYCIQALLVRRARRRLVDVPWRAGVATRAWLLGGTLVGLGIALPPDGIWFALRIVLALGVLAAFVVTARSVARDRPVVGSAAT